MARLNIRQSAPPSTVPAWTPNPMIRRVYRSMTTRTQWVRKVADSHRNRSVLQRLSFMWPRKVSQDGPPERHQHGSQIGVALFADVHLRLTLSGVSACRLQSGIATR